MHRVLVLSLLVCLAVATTIEGEYLFSFKDSATGFERVAFKTELLVSEDHHVISEWTIGAYSGLAAKASERFVEFARTHPAIDFVEPNQIANIFQEQACTTQNGATWGINRISERDLDLNGVYKYTANPSTGVNAYIIDTGIYTANNEFQNRAVWGATFTGDNNNNDCNGHGTHVAGTVGGAIYGVSKTVTLIAVKVLNCAGSGSYSGIISGIEWVLTQYQSNKVPSVSNMSLGGGYSAALNKAVAALVSGGVSCVVAAGNSNRDASGFSPASEPSAITVGATETGQDSANRQVDIRAYYSNFGSDLDVFAPGSEITAAWIGSPSAINTISGTSMASPHVAGVVAQYLYTQPIATPATVASWIVGQSTPNKITFNCGLLNPEVCNASPNKLLYSPC